MGLCSWGYIKAREIFVNPDPSEFHTCTLVYFIVTQDLVTLDILTHIIAIKDIPKKDNFEPWISIGQDKLSI